VTIRPLTDPSEFQECVELQRKAFALADVHILPVRVFVVLAHIGGLTLGAFDGERMVAFLNAIPGHRNNSLYWHSHMMAVAPDQWNQGIGSKLKLAQREHALQRGIRLIEWTFEPLKSKNAHLNIVKLGAVIRRYCPKHYGDSMAGPTSLDSDRVIAEWWIDRPRPAMEGEIRRIAIPSDIQSLQKQSIESARDIQQRVREAFLRNLAEGFFVAGFERGDEWSQYLFVREANDSP